MNAKAAAHRCFFSMETGRMEPIFVIKLNFSPNSILLMPSTPGATANPPPGDHFIAAKNPGAFNQSVEQFLNDYKE